jgi:hypothetical protein
MKHLFLIALLGCVFTFVQGQNLKHPSIWVSSGDKAKILDNISKYTWAGSFKKQMEARVDQKKNIHKKNPESLLSQMPALGDKKSRGAHNEILTLGTESAILFYLTDDEDYAQLSADILSYYTAALSLQDTSAISFYGDHWLESRNVFPKVPMIYDFIFPFLQKANTTVYDNTSKTRKPFNHDAAQTTFLKLAASDLKGITAMESNHSILAGNGALFNILMIEDDATREKFFNRLWNNPYHQKHDAFTWTLNNFSKEEGLWPEALSYGFGSQKLVLQMMNVIDRFKPELNVINKNLRILDGSFLYENFKYPNKTMMRYGDSRRGESNTTGIYQAILNIAVRKNLPAYVQKTSAILKQTYSDKGGFNPEPETQSLEWDNPLLLLWGVNIDPAIEGEKIKYNTTATASHAGIVMQRNYFCDNIEENGLMCFTGGAHYVHAHVTGIDMELYGAGYVMGADGGEGPDRNAPLHANYLRIYAGHNTVVVNGSSHGKGGWKNIYQNTTKLEAAEPKPFQEPISSSFSFTCQRLRDTINNCLQQRTTSIVRTSPVSGYYIDFFRSKSNAVNKFHDYIYHNLGDEMKMMDNKQAILPLASTPNRYQNDIGDEYQQPGWRFFEAVKTSASTTNSVKVLFSILKDNRFMHVSIPEGVNREYTSALAPPIVEAENGYNKKKTQVLTIRKPGEAWDKPFVVVYEPSKISNPTVQSVENLMDGNKIVGAKVTSLVNGTTMTDWIIAQENNTSAYNLPSEKISFKGRFGIVRKEVVNGKMKVTLYIGEGESLQFGDSLLKGNSKNQGLITKF